MTHLPGDNTEKAALEPLFRTSTVSTTVKAVGITLVLLLGFLSAHALSPAVAQEKAESVASTAALDSLWTKLDETYKIGDYRASIETAKKINDIVEPLHVDVLYRIAQMHCRLGEKVKAYEWLQMAVDAGFWNVQELLADECFTSLKQEERFRGLAKGAWANGYIAMLEREERADFQKPEEVLKALELKPGERVADIGCGSGYFTIPIAKAVGAGGSVLAIDISQEMLDYLEKRLQAEQLENVTLRKVTPDDPELPAGGADMILLVDTWHYIKDRPHYAQKLREGLAAGGRVVVIDYIPKPWEERPWGPLPQQQMSRESVDADMAAAGLFPLKVHDFLPEQYFVIYGAK